MFKEFFQAWRSTAVRRCAERPAGSRASEEHVTSSSVCFMVRHELLSASLWCGHTLPKTMDVVSLRSCSTELLGWDGTLPCWERPTLAHPTDLEIKCGGGWSHKEDLHYNKKTSFILDSLNKDSIHASIHPAFMHEFHILKSNIGESELM